MRQKKITIGETEYNLQGLNAREFLRMKKSATDERGNLDDEKFYDLICENVIISPRITLDDFETPSELQEVMKPVLRFLTGTD